jgi:hypothetical protein
MTPPGEKPSPGDYGGNGLWTILWPAGKVITSPRDQVLPDGSISVYSISMKWPWWRGIDGELKIVGHRLDGSSPPLHAYIPYGYGSTGFQANELVFPRQGCWEVTGGVGAHSLTFVTMAVEA